MIDLDLSNATLGLLALAAFVAGWIDAIAGGGGLITVPALLAAGLPAHIALGTNKGQSVFGSAVALLRFARAGMLDGARARIAFPIGFAGALAGAQLVLWIPPSTLKPVVLVLLVAVALFLLLRPRTSGARRHTTAGQRSWLTAAIALGIGAYDGFFGPGTGTFLIVAFVLCFDSELTQASANAKVVNFASNLASVTLFSLNHTIAWKVALPMAVTQLAGSFLGARFAVQGGDRVVKPVLLTVVLALVGKLAFDLLS